MGVLFLAQWGSHQTVFGATSSTMLSVSWRRRGRWWREVVVRGGACGGGGRGGGWGTPGDGSSRRSGRLFRLCSDGLIPLRCLVMLKCLFPMILSSFLSVASRDRLQSLPPVFVSSVCVTASVSCLCFCCLLSLFLLYA